jgi:hypothetical protein
MNNNLENIILEDGYNTDYIYSLIISLFYTPSDGINKIINYDTNNSNTYYLQEYIKKNFIYRIHRNISIESQIVNKFRLFLFNCGWLKESNILDHSDIGKFYDFLICGMMQYQTKVMRVDTINNTNDTVNMDMIRLTKEDIPNGSGKIINLNNMIDIWINKEFMGKNYEFKFENIPTIIPIFIDIKDENTKVNSHQINIMEGIKFSNNGDKLQRLLIWEIHSLVCQNSNGSYYSVVIENNRFVCFSDKSIPSNWIINNKDTDGIKTIMKEVTLVFYKLQ